MQFARRLHSGWFSLEDREKKESSKGDMAEVVRECGPTKVAGDQSQVRTEACSATWSPTALTELRGRITEAKPKVSNEYPYPALTIVDPLLSSRFYDRYNPTTFDPNFYTGGTDPVWGATIGNTSLRFSSQQDAGAMSRFFQAMPEVVTSVGFVRSEARDGTQSQPRGFDYSNPPQKLEEFKTQLEQYLQSGASPQDVVKALYAYAKAGGTTVTLPEKNGQQREFTVQTEPQGNGMMVHLWGNGADGQRHIVYRGIVGPDGNVTKEHDDRKGAAVAFEGTWWHRHMRTDSVVSEKWARAEDPDVADPNRRGRGSRRRHRDGDQESEYRNPRSVETDTRQNQGYSDVSLNSDPLKDHPLLTRGQQVFASRLAQQTGLNPFVIGAWLLHEESDRFARKRESAGNMNWLNIGYTDSGQRGTHNDVWHSGPIAAADATAAWIKRELNVPGFGRAAHGIFRILEAVGRPIEEQLSALQRSPWATSHYPGLRSMYRRVLAQSRTNANAG